MRASKTKDTSPILFSLLHLLPSLLLLGMIIVAIISLGVGERSVVLGAQSSLLQIRTLTIEDRIKELSGVANRVKSEAIERAERELAR